jgi:hypothetical protein
MPSGRRAETATSILSPRKRSSSESTCRRSNLAGLPGLANQAAGATN